MRQTMKRQTLSKLLPASGRPASKKKFTAEPGADCAGRLAASQRRQGAAGYYLPFIQANVVYDSTRLGNELNGSLPALTRATAYILDLLDLITLPEARTECRNP